MIHHQAGSFYFRVAILAAVAILSAEGRAQQNTPASSLPGEDVMRPTEHGLHLTPKLAEALALDFVRNEVAVPLDLSTEQERRLSQTIGNSMIAATRHNPQAAQDFVEHMFAMVWENQTDPQKPTPGQLKDIADHGRPLMPALRGVLDGMVEAGSDVLDSSQQARLEQLLARRGDLCDRLDQVLEGWSRGETKRPDAPFSEIDDAAGEEWPPSKQWKQHSETREQAWREVHEIGTRSCEEFFAAARASLVFDDQQLHRGEALLRDYQARIAAIMTLDRRRRLEENRARFFQIRSLKDQPAAPYLFHLDEEFQKLLAPVEELNAKFREELLAIATDRQREAFFSRIAERAAQHGLAMDDADRRILLPPEK